jgi:HEAT repeat protein
MSQLLEWLAGGDLRGDGLSNEVADLVLEQPDLIGELIVGLDHQDSTVRGHTADSLEKIARERPELLEAHISRILESLEGDPVPMVKMHLAMILGHLADDENRSAEFIAALLPLLREESVFAASWAIVSLCILGRLYPVYNEQILRQIAALQNHPSAAIRSKVRYALPLLMDERSPFPKGWIKRASIRSACG